MIPEVIERQEQNNQVIELTPTVKNDFVASAKWGKFFGIISFIGAGLCFIFAIGSLFMKSAMDTMTDEFEGMELSIGMMGFAGAVSFIIYLICAVICVVIGYFLFKASKNILDGINLNNQDKIAVGSHSLKTFCQIYGIITIIGLAIAVLTILGAMVVGCTAAMM